MSDITLPVWYYSTTIDYQTMSNRHKKQLKELSMVEA